nr:MAG TPA: hypothetical protein [Caudoviricetes sp.]
MAKERQKKAILYQKQLGFFRENRREGHYGRIES